MKIQVEIPQKFAITTTLKGLMWKISKHLIYSYPINYCAKLDRSHRLRLSIASIVSHLQPGRYTAENKPFAIVKEQQIKRATPCNSSFYSPLSMFRCMIMLLC